MSEAEQVGAEQEGSFAQEEAPAQVEAAGLGDAAREEVAEAEGAAEQEEVPVQAEISAPSAEDGAGREDLEQAEVPGAVDDAVPEGDAPAEDEAAPEEEGETRTAPSLDSDEELDAALEALLLVVDVPAGEELLASTLDQPVARIRTALQRLSAGYAEASRGIDLRRVGDGWRFYTRETYAPYVERYLLDGQRAKLTRAALETLAVIAYRQPVTRSRVAAVRGVNVDGVIRTLVGRGLIEEAGTDPETGGILYCTTELFLERLGLSSLKDLPPLAPLLPEVDAIDDV